MSTHTNDEPSDISALVVFAVGTWVAFAPAVCGHGAGWSPLLLDTLPGTAAALAGLAMLAPHRLLSRAGSRVAVGAGAWMVLAALTIAVWQAQQKTGAFGLLLWLAFFLQTGALLAVFGSGILDAMTTTLREGRVTRCETRHRSAASRRSIDRTRRHGAARRHRPPAGPARD